MAGLSPPLEPTKALVRVRQAVATSFFVSGAVVSSWVPHIPGIQRALGLNPAALGLVLVGPAVGSVVAMAIAGGISARIGTARLTRVAILIYCCLLPLTVIAPHPVLLAGVLALMGLGSGALGVAMNAEAVEVERAFGRGIMSSFHALYSLGCLAGASVGGLVIYAGVPPVWHLALVGVLVCLLGVWASGNYLPDEASIETEKAPLLILPTRFLAVLGLGAFCAFVVEGAMADWAGIYLRDNLHASTAFAAAGYAAFSFTMVVGRLTGDATTRALGASGMVRLGGALATVGLVLALVVHQPWGAVGGFGLVGAGMANIVPNFYTAAGRETRMPTARAIAAVSSFGFAGFLSGPPLIGAIAQMTSLGVAIGVVALFTALICALAGNVNARPKRPVQV